MTFYIHPLHWRQKKRIDQGHGEGLNQKKFCNCLTKNIPTFFLGTTWGIVKPSIDMYLYRSRSGTLVDTFYYVLTWRIIPVNEWLITMVSFRPLSRATSPVSIRSRYMQWHIYMYTSDIRYLATGLYCWNSSLHAGCGWNKPLKWMKYDEHINAVCFQQVTQPNVVTWLVVCWVPQPDTRTSSKIPSLYTQARLMLRFFFRRLVSTTSIFRITNA